MLNSSAPRRILHVTAMVAMFAWLGAVQAADLNPKAISIKLPDQIKWVEGNGGAANAILVGDPTKPGLYIELTKWHARSHEPSPLSSERSVHHGPFGNVVGRHGIKYDPDSTKPIPAGSFVTHYGKEIHYDGAKDGDVVLEILGEGPATNTPAEVK